MPNETYDSKTTEQKLMAFLDWCRNRPAFNSPNGSAMEIVAVAERLHQEIELEKFNRRLANGI